MDYSTLVTNVNSIAENTFTTAVVDMLIQQAEQKIFYTAQLPDFRKNSTGTLTADNKYLAVPSDFLYTHSLAVIAAGGAYTFLLPKDVNFMREAYPDPTATGTPKHYGQFSEDTFILGPTPDASLSVELHYGFQPTSIVTATNTWLGDNFETVLLAGTLVEAARFLQQEEDVVANYEKSYMQAIGLLKKYADGSMRQDSYRSGQVTIPVN